eukprot:3162595-Amphidinium_carterae.1
MLSQAKRKHCKALGERRQRRMDQERWRPLNGTMWGSNTVPALLRHLHGFNAYFSCARRAEEETAVLHSRTSMQRLRNRVLNVERSACICSLLNRREMLCWKSVPMKGGHCVCNFSVRSGSLGPIGLCSCRQSLCAV